MSLIGSALSVSTSVIGPLGIPDFIVEIVTFFVIVLVPPGLLGSGPEQVISKSVSFIIGSETILPSAEVTLLLLLLVHELVPTDVQLIVEVYPEYTSVGEAVTSRVIFSGTPTVATICVSPELDF